MSMYAKYDSSALTHATLLSFFPTLQRHLRRRNQNKFEKASGRKKLLRIR